MSKRLNRAVSDAFQRLNPRRRREREQLEVRQLILLLNHRHLAHHLALLDLFLRRARPRVRTPLSLLHFLRQQRHQPVLRRPLPRTLHSLW